MATQDREPNLQRSNERAHATSVRATVSCGNAAHHAAMPRFMRQCRSHIMRQFRASCGNAALHAAMPLAHHAALPLLCDNEMKTYIAYRARPRHVMDTSWLTVGRITRVMHKCRPPQHHICFGSLESGGLQSGGLQCPAPPIVDLLDHSPVPKKTYSGSRAHSDPLGQP